MWPELAGRILKVTCQYVLHSMFFVILNSCGMSSKFIESIKFLINEKQISFESICTDLSSVVLPDYLSTKDVLFPA